MATSTTDTFVTAFKAVRGEAHVAQNSAQAVSIVGEIIAKQQARRVALAGLCEELTRDISAWCEAHGVAVLKPPYEAAALPGVLDGPEVGITGIAFGIAETGTLVEVATNDARRLVSALPRTHIGIVRASDMAPTLRDASARMREIMQHHERDVMFSFLSGPSRTGDIEMILTLGVHGPEIAHAILLEEAPHA